MKELTIGIIIIVVSTLGYLSNWINWRFLNYKMNYWLYYMGAFIHESSHAILCLATGAKISKYKVISSQPQVIYSNSRIPILGDFLISIAPILGGLTFLFFINKFFLANQFYIPEFSNWKYFITDFFKLATQIDIAKWQDWVAIFLFLNMGAMIAPSWQDLRNVWLFIVFLVFIPWSFFTHLGLLAISFILIGILFQIALTIIISFFFYIVKIGSSS